MITVYNTRSHDKEALAPINNGSINIYSCGPTVYDRLHIGNWAAYIRWDTLVRQLRQHGFKAERIINITDVGHLVSDEDEGEDKLEVGAHREGLNAWQIAEKYYADFISGFENLGLLKPLKFAKATEHIQEQIDLIKQLESKGYTYVIDDGVYFDSDKFADYGKFARLNVKEQRKGARVHFNPQKRNISDFALWKFSPVGGSRDMEWQSPWGKGFPGWHIECSAMALKYFDNHLDIHTGGIDHIPVHHTNEIAQSEAATGHIFGKYWLHNNFLLVNGTKISKSLGNVYTLDDIQKNGGSLEGFKLFIHQSHYRNESNFTWDNLAGAESRLKSYRAMADLRWQPVKNSPLSHKKFAEVKTNFLKSIQDDMDTPAALAVLSEFQNLVSEAGINHGSLKAFTELLKLIDNLLGLTLMESDDISQTAKSLLKKRNLARKKKDWGEADRLRNELLAIGLKLEDSSAGTFWFRD